MIAERVFLSFDEKIKVHNIRPATVCGYSKRQRLDVSVNILTNLGFHNKEITIFGGSQLRPNIHIKDMVRAYKKLIEAENPSNPVSDDAIVEILSEEGIVLARRTVAKYRKMENIPSSFARKRRNVIAGAI